MLKRFLGSEPGTAFLSKLASSYIRFVYATSTLVREPEDTEVMQDTEVDNLSPSTRSVSSAIE